MSFITFANFVRKLQWRQSSYDAVYLWCMVISGLRQDYRLRECQGAQYKTSFSDMGYSLLGYNVLRGFPLAVGHDPGFTLPIFTADYSEGKQTADCQYSVPRGLFLEPDVSCETSFSSSVTQTSFEFSKSLSVSAHVSGGGWGLSFSASAGYKESSSEISTGESVFIFSTASCTYYFSKLMKKGPPKLHPVFKKWVGILAETDEKATYMDFFDTFGTHFPTMVTYGARFTYQHSMSSSSYKSEREKGVNVAIQASYSGAFSAGGGFNMDSSQRAAASSFSKSVETKTITVGAPPPSDGDAMKWASEVKNSPVPVKYDLESIENLFTDDYMLEMPENVTRIIQNIQKYQYEYCLMLKRKGETNSCEQVKPGIELANTKLENYFKIDAASYSECIDLCLENIHCTAISYQSGTYEVCYMFREAQSETIMAKEEKDWKSLIFPAKLKTYLRMGDTIIVGTQRTLEKAADKRADYKRCYEMCLQDAHCAAFSHCLCPDQTESCKLYDARNIEMMKYGKGVSVYFLSESAKQGTLDGGNTTTATTSTTTDGGIKTTVKTTA